MSTSPPTAGALDWLDELPNTMERAILAFQTTSTAIFARTLQLGIKAGCVDPVHFVLSDLEALGVSKKTLENGLKGMLGVFIAHAPDQIEFIPKPDTASFSKEKKSEESEKPKPDPKPLYEEVEIAIESPRHQPKGAGVLRGARGDAEVRVRAERPGASRGAGADLLGRRRRPVGDRTRRGRPAGNRRTRACPGGAGLSPGPRASPASPMTDDNRSAADQQAA